MSLGHPQQVHGLLPNYAKVQDITHNQGHQQPHFYQNNLQNPYYQSNGQFGVPGQLFHNYYSQFYQPHPFAHLQQGNNHHHAYLLPPYPNPMQGNNMPTGNNLFFLVFTFKI